MTRVENTCLQHLHDLVDEQRSSGEHGAGNPRIEHECDDGEHPRETAQSRLVERRGRRRVVRLVARGSGLRARRKPVSKQDDDNDCDTDANCRSVAPANEPIRVVAVGFPSWEPVRDREKPQYRKSERYETRDRSISNTNETPCPRHEASRSATRRPSNPSCPPPTTMTSWKVSPLARVIASVLS